MAKNHDVLWSEEASQRVTQITGYLLENWSRKEVDKFLEALSRFEIMVSRFPEIYPESQFKPGYRRAVISKQNSVIYFIDHDKIRVYTIFDNRQNPEML